MSLYRNIGPPRGRFSHLAMFRIGSALFIPAYLTVTLYRAFASGGEGNSFWVMTGKSECRQASLGTYHGLQRLQSVPLFVIAVPHSHIHRSRFSLTTWPPFI